MKAIMALALIATWAVSVAAQPPLLTLVKTPEAKPPSVIGFPLRATDGLRLDAAGKEYPVPKKTGETKEFEDTGGEQSQGVGPGGSLRWRLTKVPGGKCYFYVLCRTGHQKGYEYVAPQMAYAADVNGKAVEIEPVAEFPAVRTYQSKDGWGHDMGWVRSKAMPALKPGDAVTIGCTEKYAFVTRLVLVDEQSHRLSQLVGRCSRVEERLKDADSLLNKIAEVFPAESVKAAVAEALQSLSRQRAEFADLHKAMSEAAAKVERGEAIDAEGLSRQAETLARQVENAEVALFPQVRTALKQLATGLRSRLAPAERPSGGFEVRQAGYFAGVGRAYLSKAEEGTAAKESGLDGLRRFATYLWRAEQFALKAEDAAARAGPAMPTRLTPETRFLRENGFLAECPRGELLLNGEWDMTTQGTPNAPADGDWFKIRVPHGPWAETVGQFMALDRKWPRGQNWAWYRVAFSVPAAWTTGRVKLHFESVFHLCEVYVNGQYCGRHIGGFDGFDIDITAVAKPGQANQLLCFVHDTSVTALEKSPRADEPKGCSSGPNHYKISDLWGQRFGGIWQDVSLRVEPAVKVDDVFVLTSCRKKTLTAQTTLRNETTEPVTLSLAQDVLDNSKVALSLPAQSVKLEAGQSRRVDVSVEWPNPKLWGIGGDWGEPKHLYHLRSSLSAEARNPFSLRKRVGFVP